MKVSAHLMINLLKRLRNFYFHFLNWILGKCCIYDNPYFFIVTLFLFFSIWAQGKDLSGEISQLEDTVHLEFVGEQDWSYQLFSENESKQKLILSPFDQNTENQLLNWKGPYISKIEVDKKGIDGKYVITFYLSGKDIESFNYRTDDPSKLVIDFYQKESSRKIHSLAKNEQGTSQKNQVKKPMNPINTKNVAYKKKELKLRKPAGDEFLTGGDQDKKQQPNPHIMGGVYDGNDPDYTRFQVKDYEIKEDAIIASRQNIYIRFPMLQMSSSELPELLDQTPEYAIIPKDTEENKQARFLLHLYLKKRSAAFLKSYQFFQSKFPASEYGEIIHHIAAETYFQLYRDKKESYYFQQTLNEYQLLLKLFPQSPLSERISLLMAYMQLDRNDGVNSLQTFQIFLNQYPQSKHHDAVMRAMAYAYLMLKKYDDALATYQKLIKESKDKEVVQEALYRLGDVPLAHREYGEAVKFYEEALKKEPKMGDRFPNAYFNLGESYFWMGEYKKSLEANILFLKKYPTHEYDGYAMTRIGEIMEIMGVDPRRVANTYLESFFRFRDSPGAGVARLRMLSQQMKEMKDKELNSALNEMREIASQSELPKMDEFMHLMVADGMYRKGEFDQAINYLVSFYQKNPASTKLSVFRQRILQNITHRIAQLIEEKNYMEVLAQFTRYSATWLKNHNRVDVPFFLGRAYELAGVHAEAEKIYVQLLAQRKNMKGAEEEKERKVHEFLPTIDELSLRLAICELKKKDYSKAHQYLAQIENVNSLNTSQRTEWVNSMATVAEETGKNQEAITYLQQLLVDWKNSPELLPAVLLRMAEMKMKLKLWDEAEKNLNSIRMLHEQKVPFAEEIWVSALEKRGDVFYQQKKMLSAAEGYLELLDQYENKRPLAYIRYRVGSILYENGDIKGAEKVWSQMSTDKSGMYRKLAEERLAQAQWQDEYKKYLDRIPAMEGLRGDKRNGTN